MPTPVRVLAGLVGLFFLLPGVNWAIRPAAAAEGIGLPLLDGVARSSQIGDLGAFFLGLAAMTFLGVFRQQRTWFHAAALLVGLAAVMRTLAWAAHGAPFVVPFIGIEVVLAAFLVFAATRTSSP